MPKHEETRPSPYSAQQLFQLVMDIESYPEFLPWCSAARVRKEHSREGVLANLTIRFGPFSETYTSHVVFREPTPKKKDYTIQVHLVDGPFSHLSNDWCFSDTKGGGSDIYFAIDFAFRSKMMEKMMSGMFHRAMEKMIAAFEARAKIIYSEK